MKENEINFRNFESKGYFLMAAQKNMRETAFMQIYLW